MRRAAFALVAFTFFFFLAPRAAFAHALGVSNGDYSVQGNDVVASLTFARAELAATGMDATLVQRMTVTANGIACAPAVDSTSPTENDGLTIHAHFRCKEPPRTISVQIPFFDDLTHGHRHVAHAPHADDILHRGHPAFTFTSTPTPTPTSTPTPTPTSTSTSPLAVDFIRMGLEHILSGYDHLLFIFALVLVGGRAKDLLAIVSAFTLAHSITLALAALGVWAPGARFVEPAIALSIAYVGIENLVSKRPSSGRWKLTFAFGLVHGFGFAGALRAIDLPRAKIPLALVSFNVGVELGQLAVLAALLPLLALLRKSDRAPQAVRALSGAVVALGVVWFLERALAA